MSPLGYLVLTMGEPLNSRPQFFICTTNVRLWNILDPFQF